MAVEGAPTGYLNDYYAPGSGKNKNVGVLLLHGFTGSPASMRPWAHFLHQRGFTVRVPLIPGHGTKMARSQQSEVAPVDPESTERT